MALLKKDDSAFDKRSARTSLVPVIKPRKPPLRVRMWTFLDDPQSSTSSYLFMVAMAAVNVIATATYVISTMKSFQKWRDGFDVIENLCMAIFTCEVTLRIFSCPRMKLFLSDPFNVIDLLAVVPFFVGKMLPEDASHSLSVIRSIRPIQVARVLKISRYSTSVRVFMQAISLSINSLMTLVYLVFIAMVIFSSFVYYAELTADGCRMKGWKTDKGEDCSPERESDRERHCLCRDPNPFTSIPATFWWCMVTMTTVGYGDTVPVTDFGRLISACAIVTGMIVLALPISVIGTNFNIVFEAMNREEEKRHQELLEKERQRKEAEERGDGGDKTGLVSSKKRKNKFLRKLNNKIREKRQSLYGVLHSSTGKPLTVSAPKPETKPSGGGLSSTDLQFEMQAMERRLQEQMSKLILGLAAKMSEVQQPSPPFSSTASPEKREKREGDNGFAPSSLPPLDENGFTPLSLSPALSSTTEEAPASTTSLLEFEPFPPIPEQAEEEGESDWEEEEEGEERGEGGGEIDLENPSAARGTKGKRGSKRGSPRHPRLSGKRKTTKRPSVDLLN